MGNGDEVANSNSSNGAGYSYDSSGEGSELQITGSRSEAGQYFPIVNNVGYASSLENSDTENIRMDNMDMNSDLKITSVKSLNTLTVGNPVTKAGYGNGGDAERNAGSTTSGSTGEAIVSNYPPMPSTIRAIPNSSSERSCPPSRSDPKCKICRVVGDDLLHASSIVMMYYGLGSKADNPGLSVCRSCSSQAEGYKSKSIDNYVRLITKPPTLPLVEDLVEDDDSAGRPLPKRLKQDNHVDRELDLDGIVKRFFSSYTIPDQVNKSFGFAQQELQLPELDWGNLRNLGKPRRCARMSFARSTPSATTAMTTSADDVQFIAQIITLDDDEGPWEGIEEITNSDESGSQYESVTAATGADNFSLEDLPRHADDGKPFVPRRVCDNDEVIAPRQTSTGKCWVPAVYLRKVSPPDQSPPTDCLVQFGGNSTDVAVEEILPLACVADGVTPLWTLPGNLRVLVKLGKSGTEMKCDCDKGVDHFLPGAIIAFRAVHKVRTAWSNYVVCFDNGEIRKAKHCDVRILLGGSFEEYLHLRKEIYPETNQFVRALARSGSWEFRVRKNCVGDILIAWFEGKWRLTRVFQTDDEMVEVVFETAKEKKLVKVPYWILRGSPRFHRNLQAFNATQKDSASIPILNPDQLTDLSGYEGVVKKDRIPFQLPVAGVNGMTKGHVCDERCAAVYDPSKHPRHISPLAIPFWFGWSSSDLQKVKNSPIGSSGGRAYTAPCGRILRTPRDMVQYLHATQCKLQVDWFDFRTRISCLNIFKPDRSRKFRMNGTNFNDDISLGQEKAPIQIINTVDRDPLPSFTSAPKCVPDNGVKPANFLTYCCDCTDGCLDTNKCACWRRTLEGMKDIPSDGKSKGYRNRKLDECIYAGIFECNDGCSCKPEICSNRVTQSGVQWPIQVFKTKQKGWAIRAMVDIPKGSFICEYAGRLTTNQVYEEEGYADDDEYMLDLTFIRNYTDAYLQEALREGNCREDRVGDDQVMMSDLMKEFPSGEQKFVITGKQMGNVGRFFSHSCSPNTFSQPVFVDTHDVRFPVIAFFTTTDVYAGMELTWNYGYKDETDDRKQMVCKCGSDICQGRI